MTVGDLISFKPKGFDADDYSNPAIVLNRFEPTARATLPEMWVVWCEGFECIVDEDNYDVIYLTSSLQENA